MKFRGGEFSTGTMRNFQSDLTIWAMLVDQVHPGPPTNTVKRILTSHDFANLL